METRTIRDRKFLLPSIQADEKEERTTPPSSADTVSEARVAGPDWSRLQLDGGGILHCVLDSVTMTEARLTSCRIAGSALTGVDFSSSRWESSKIERCLFKGCKFAGANLSEFTAQDVIFDGCRFEYAYIKGLRATGSVAFVNCTLREAAVEDCRLRDAVFANCVLGATEFKYCDLRGADFRGTNLEDIRGLECFKGVVVEEGQFIQLTTALVRDFGIEVKDRPIE